MAEWNAAQYLKFKAERTQPALDLARRLSLLSPDTVLDIGCGPGNSTAGAQRSFSQRRYYGIEQIRSDASRGARFLSGTHLFAVDASTLFNP